MADTVLYHDLIAERYFFPRPDSPSPCQVVNCPDGVSLNCAGYDNGKSLTLVHFHGNGEVVADYQPDYVEALAALGLNLFFAEYRGYGRSGGRPHLGALLDDVEVLHDHLDCPDSKVVVYGRSVGSIMAIEWVARYPQTAGLILESGIADVLERLLLRVGPHELGVSRLELEQQVRARLDHRAKLSAYGNPALVMHAGADLLVMPSHAQRNHEWLGSEDKRLVLFRRGDHNTIMAANWDQYLNEIGEFVAKLKQK